MAPLKDNKILRISLIVLSQIAYIVALVINALAGPGKGPFQHSTGNVSDRYQTEITPAGWTFSIWGVIYSWLLLMNIYILSWFCRGLYSSPAILPSEFFVLWIINLILNCSWLVLWDRELMIPALVVLALIAFTNYLLIYFSCVGLRAHGSWLKQHQSKDLLCIIVLLANDPSPVTDSYTSMLELCHLTIHKTEIRTDKSMEFQVQNGIATYATWTTIATLLNFAVVLNLASVSATNAATASLSILLLEVIVWFSIENYLIEKHVRYILSVYPVIIYALIGSVNKHYDSTAPTRNAVFSVVLLVLACIVFVVRLALVVWRHRTQPLFTLK